MANTPITFTEQDMLNAAKQYDPVLRKLPMIALQDTLKYVTVMSGIQGDRVLGQLKAKGSWATYRHNDDQYNVIDIDARTVTTRLLSLELQFDPNLVAGKLYNQRPNNGDALANLPFVAQVLAQAILESSEEVNQAIFGAAYNAAGKTPLTSFDGWDTIAAAEEGTGLTAAKGNFLDLAQYNLNEDNTFDAINYAWQMCDEKLKQSTETVFCYCSPNVQAYYNHGYLQKVGNVVYNTQYQQTEVLGSNGRCVLVPIISKAGSNYLQFTTKSNMIFGCSDANDINSLTVKVPGLYDVLAGGTMWLGTQYEFLDKSKILVVKHKGVSAPTNPLAAGVNIPSTTSDGQD